MPTGTPGLVSQDRKERDALTDEARTLELFHGLMQLDTVNPPGNEQAAAVYLHRQFSAANIPCEVQELGGGRANFIAHIGSGGPVLELGGHLDVVPFPGEWLHPPLAATEENGRFYGRGACDMKGGVAAMCAAALGLHAEKVPLHGTLRLAFVADEEHANLGMHAYLARYPAADWAVLGEPTDLQVAVAHRGAARFYIDLHGRACHAALPYAGETAVTKAARAVLALDALNTRLGNLRHPVLPGPSLAVTQIEGYEKDNVIPARVRLLTDHRLLPGTTQAQAQRLQEGALLQAGITDFTLESRFFMPGGELAADDGFVQQACAVTGRVLGREQTPHAFGASCEQCFLLQAGARALVLGPGSLEQAHTTNEYVSRSQLLQAVVCYRALALRMLNGDEQK